MFLLVLFLCCLQCEISDGYDITGCESANKRQIYENRPPSSVGLTCTGIGQSDTFVWDIAYSNGSSFQFATCFTSNSSCSPPLRADYSVSAANSIGTSTLTVTGNFRNVLGGTVRCANLTTPGSDSSVVDNSTAATCFVRVVYPAAQHNNKQIQIYNSDWTVKGSFTVDRIFASDDQYTCNWTLYGNQGNQVIINGTVRLTSNTTDSTTGLVYHTANCSFSKPVTDLVGSYTSYTTNIDAGTSGSSSNNMFTVERPTSNATVFNCSHSLIPRGSSVTLTCQAANATPPALVTWTGNTTQMQSTDVLTVTNITQTTTFTCGQYWGANDKNNYYRETACTVNVEASPTTGPAIQCPASGATVTCICQAAGSNPPALVSFSGPAKNSTDVFELNIVQGSVTVTCHQYWGSDDKYTMSSQHTVTASDSTSLVVGIVLGLIIAALIVVIVVLECKRGSLRNCLTVCFPLYSTLKRRQTTDHTYTDLTDPYQPTPGAQDASKVEQTTGASAVIVNMAFEPEAPPVTPTHKQLTGAESSLYEIVA